MDPLSLVLETAAKALEVGEAAKDAVSVTAEMQEINETFSELSEMAAGLKELPEAKFVRELGETVREFRKFGSLSSLMSMAQEINADVMKTTVGQLITEAYNAPTEHEALDLIKSAGCAAKEAEIAEVKQKLYSLLRYPEVMARNGINKVGTIQRGRGV